MFAFGKCRKLFKFIFFDRQTLGNGGNTRVAGSTIDFAHIRAAGELPNKGVFTPAGTDD